MPARAEHGFSLLETLVALVVLAMLTTGLTQGVRAGVRAWQFQKQSLAGRDDLQGTDTLLRGLVARMDPGGASGQPPVIFGSAHNLTFTTTLPQSADALATREADVTLGVDDAHRLRLLWLPHYRNRIGPAPLPKQSVLLGDVDHLDVAYWKDARTGWLPAWTGPALPRLVRIRIAFGEARGRRAPDIVVAPMRNRWRL
jgi:prepilin-type N-terminal cleavage/methylation domain-containing protein